MNNKKKIIGIFLLLVMMLYLVGCTKVATPVATSTATPTSHSTTTTTTTASTQAKATTKAEKTTKKGESTSKKSTTTSTTKADVSKPKATTKSQSTSAKKENTTTKKAATVITKSTTVKKTTTTQKSTYCTLNIQCKSILKNMDDLAAGHSQFVPSNGIILQGYKYDVGNDENAYDVLKSACKAKGIKLTTSNTIYGVYVVGINNLDEKDCGKYSGWKYKVNGVVPNKACDKFQIKKGDKIEFFYVCTY